MLSKIISEFIILHSALNTMLYKVTSTYGDPHSALLVLTVKTFRVTLIHGFDLEREKRMKQYNDKTYNCGLCW